MHYIPIKTRILLPPQDDLLAVMDDYLPALENGDVVLVSSKVVAIDEGRCVAIADGGEKAAMIERDADVVIPTDYRTNPLTIKHHTFLGAAGVDESNGNGYYVKLPLDPFASAARLHAHLLKKHQLTRLGVIVTDSRSLPLRYGASGVGIGWWGIEPLQNHVGKPDLFGRPFKYERSNVIDSLAAPATVVMGETNECQPLVIVRGVPGLAFTSNNTKEGLFVPYEHDTFRILYERFLK